MCVILLIPFVLNARMAVQSLELVGLVGGLVFGGRVVLWDGNVVDVVFGLLVGALGV